MNTLLKILIADDHPLMRKGIRAAIEEGDMAVHITEACDGEVAYEHLTNCIHDVALVDVDMPRLSGIALLQKLRCEKNATKLIVLTMHKDEDVFNQAMDAGARGYLLKEFAAEAVLECIAAVQKGDYYVSPVLAGYLVRRAQQPQPVVLSIPYYDTLTRAEQKVLRLIAEQKTSSEIAIQLFISPKTVDNHRNNISKKLRLTGTHSLVKFALSNKDALLK